MVPCPQLSWLSPDGLSLLVTGKTRISALHDLASRRAHSQSNPFEFQTATKETAS